MITLNNALEALSLDVESCIKRGILVKDGEDCPDHTENVHTLASIHAHDVNIGHDLALDVMYEFLYEYYKEYC